MISVRSPQDVRVVNNRYALVKDMFGTIRVVSLVRLPARELKPRANDRDGISYTFDRMGIGYKPVYNQRQLLRTFEANGRSPSPTQSELLKSAVSIAPEVRVHASTNPSDFAGLPRVDNHQLDPQKGGWVIATVTPTGLLFGSKPKVHTNQGAAEAELQRLATVSPGTEFVLLKAVKTAMTQTVQTKTFA